MAASPTSSDASIASDPDISVGRDAQSFDTNSMFQLTATVFVFRRRDFGFVLEAPDRFFWRAAAGALFSESDGMWMPFVAALAVASDVVFQEEKHNRNKYISVFP